MYTTMHQVVFTVMKIFLPVLINAKLYSNFILSNFRLLYTNNSSFCSIRLEPGASELKGRILSAVPQPMPKLGTKYYPIANSNS